MKGLDLARAYYESYGRPMIHDRFPAYEARITVGLVGEGSECFGFDDAISQDHDFGPAFCMWLDGSAYDAIGSELQRAYEALPATFAGLQARRDNRLTGHRVGVFETGDFYRRFLGKPEGPETLTDWLDLPIDWLATASNGAVFAAGDSGFMEVREKLLRGYPRDVRIKKMVACAARMSQSGQYNYPRCLKRGEYVGADLALAEFIRNGMIMSYLHNNRYAPYYKWMHRGLEGLPICGDTRALFVRLVSPDVAYDAKLRLIETICDKVVDQWRAQGLTAGSDSFLQAHLDSLMRHIDDSALRSMHWMRG